MKAVTIVPEEAFSATRHASVLSGYRAKKLSSFAL
jgi:hypothetical protein